MIGGNPQKKKKVWKGSNGFLVLVLVSVFCFGNLIPVSRPYDSTLNQRFHSFASCDLKDQLLGYFSPNPNYILRAAGSFLKATHFAIIPDSDYFLSRLSLARLIESPQTRYHAAILVDSTLKERAPPLFLSAKAIL